MTYAKGSEPGKTITYELEEYDMRLGWIKATYPLDSLKEAREHKRKLKERRPDAKTRIVKTETKVTVLYSEFVQYLKVNKPMGLG